MEIRATIDKIAFFLVDAILIVALIIVVSMAYQVYKDFTCRLQGKTYKNFTCSKPIKLPPNYLTPPR